MTKSKKSIWTWIKMYYLKISKLLLRPIIILRKLVVKKIRLIIKRESLQVLMSNLNNISGLTRNNPDAYQNLQLKSFLFCTAYFGDSKRYNSWIKYFNKHKGRLGVKYLFLIDDASQRIDLDEEITVINADFALPELLKEGVYVVTFNEHLGRQGKGDYAGWWRSFTYSIHIAQTYKFDKIIHIESDFYILSDVLFEYLAEIKSGWISLWSNKYNFPETGIQVICKNMFESFQRVRDIAMQSNFVGLPLGEHALPFTSINKSFLGDRDGEGFKKKYNDEFVSNIDYIGQVKDAKLISMILYKQVDLNGN